MMVSNLYTLLVILCVCHLVFSDAGCPCNDKYADISKRPDVFESSSLPSQQCCLPTVGNGYLATVVYSDTIYVNGIYNGRGGNSHRARIPSTAAITVSSKTAIKKQSYSLSVTNGTFYHRIDTGVALVEQRLYAHQTFPYILINEIAIQRTGQVSGPITFMLTNNTRNGSGDVEFGEVVSYDNTRMMIGETVESETSESSTVSIAVNWTAIPNHLSLPADDKYKLWTFITAIGLNQKSASKLYAHGVQLATTGVLHTDHVKAWEEKWNHGRIEVDDLNLAKEIYGSMYYILSSLPSLNYYDQEFPFHFYGLSPGGLAHGGSGLDYFGHVFWDQETWMYPPILMFHPLLARVMLESRSYQLDAAKSLAKSRGWKGAQFPWEMAFSGSEVCPADIYSLQENHINGDIAYAAEQYLSVTADVDFLRNSRGYEMIADLAKYWESRVVFNSATGLYDIHGVMPPDEYHSNVTNSVYTNTVAQLSLRLPEYAGKLINVSVPSTWSKIADKLVILYSDAHKYHPEFEGYTIGTSIKQADAILLGFPLNQKMERDVRYSDLQIYKPVTDSDGPAMSWAMFSVGYGDVGSFQERDEMFQRSQKNTQQPFHVWTEFPSGGGAINFITGMGGFLQSVLFGYAGFRIHQEYLLFDFNLPNGTNTFNITGLNYLGSEIDFVADVKTVSVTLTNQQDLEDGAIKLRLVAQSGATYSLVKDKTVILPRSGWVKIENVLKYQRP
ncbi:protein-glucosylgalactosylhydroxylysine glucosidase-like [Asterias amurensis]|uniref:protein-glucosylgalactosylhydroxylysine glucosidase-like n=1 Tax=Asterias amurensis TaxID=7602 RepID=UPI003AB4E594